MSAGTNAFGARAGFNQSGGAYFMTLTAFETQAAANTAPTPLANGSVYINTLVTGGSNSGGAWVPPTLALTTMSNILGATSLAQASTMGASIGLTAANKLLKDMGRTVVSAGRTFRKFAPVVASNPSSFGTVGAAGATPNAGYGAFYLEVGREGAGAGSNVAPIARYF
jgi:hypothetical protein